MSVGIFWRQIRKWRYLAILEFKSLNFVDVVLFTLTVRCCCIALICPFFLFLCREKFFALFALNCILFSVLVLVQPIICTLLIIIVIFNLLQCYQLKGFNVIALHCVTLDILV